MIAYGHIDVMNAFCGEQEAYRERAGCVHDRTAHKPDARDHVSNSRRRTNLEIQTSTTHNSLHALHPWNRLESGGNLRECALRFLKRRLVGVGGPVQACDTLKTESFWRPSICSPLHAPLSRDRVKLDSFRDRGHWCARVGYVQDISLYAYYYNMYDCVKTLTRNFLYVPRYYTYLCVVSTSVT